MRSLDALPVAIFGIMFFVPILHCLTAGAKSFVSPQLTSLPRSRARIVTPSNPPAAGSRWVGYTRSDDGTVFSCTTCHVLVQLTFDVPDQSRTPQALVPLPNRGGRVEAVVRQPWAGAQ